MGSKYSVLFHHLTDAVYISDLNGNLLEVNDAACRMLGYSREELLEMNISDINPSEEGGTLKQRIDTVLADGEATIKGEHIAKDGKAFPVDIHATTFELDGEDVILGIARDISRIRYLNSVLKGIRNVNQLITKETDRSKLVQKACENLTETLGYHTAWLVLFDEDGSFSEIGFSGIGKAEFSSIEEMLREGKLTRCGNLVMEGEGPLVIDDRKEFCSDCPLAASYGDRGAMSMRLEFNGNVYGLMSVSAPKELVGDNEGIELFKELTGDLSFALHKLEQKTEKDRIEEELKENEKRFRALFMKSPVGIAQVSLDFRIVEANEVYASMIGHTKEELVGKPIWEITYPDDIPQNKEMQERLAKGEIDSYTMEKRFKHRDGRVVHCNLKANLIRDPEGNPDHFIGILVDITEEKKALVSLKESEERFRNTVKEAPYPIMLHAEDGEVLLVNSVWTEITGYTGEEIPTISEWTEKAYGERMEVVKKDIDRLYSLQERIDEGEYLIRTKGGEARTWHFSSAPLGYLPDGRRMVTSMAVDVTENKRTREKLKNAVRHLRMLSECNQMLVRTSDEKMLLDEINRIIVEYGGYELSWIGYKLMDEKRSVDPVSSHGDRSGYLEDIRITWAEDEHGRGPAGTAIRTGRSSIARNLETENGYGPWRERDLEIGFRSSVALPLKVDNKTIGALNIYSGTRDSFDEGEMKILEELAYDISYGIQTIRGEEIRRKGEAALREKELLLERSQMMAHLGSWVLNVEDQELRWSEEVYRIFGAEASDLDMTYSSFLECVHPEDRKRVDQAYSSSVDEGRDKYEIEHRIIRRDTGEVRHVHELCDHFKDEKGDIVRSVGIVHDITERKRAEESIEREKKRAQLYLDLLGHDIGNLHQGIASWLSIAEASRENVERASMALSQSLGLIDRSKSLVKNVKLLSKLSETEPELSEIDIIPIVDRTVEEVKGIFPDRNIEVIRNVETEEAIILCEPLVEELFFNLLHNAVKFQMGTDNWVEIFIGPSEDKDGYLRISIADKGPGIPDRTKGRVFQRYMSGGETPQTGIGLSLVDALVERYGGTIKVADRVEGDYSKGARFVLDFSDASRSGS